MGHDKIEERSPAVLDLFILKENKKIRSSCHHFPGNKKKEGIVSQHDEKHAGEKERIKNYEIRYRTKAEKTFNIPDGIYGYEKREQTHDSEKKTGQEVEPQVKGKVGQTDGQNDLVDGAARYRPHACGRSEKRCDGGKGKTRVDEKPLVQAQKRRQRQKEQEQRER